MIRLENISKDFVVDGKTVHAVKDVTIEIDKGQIFGIIGFSGAGKSTLVRCINLLERPTSGKVFLEDTELTALPYKKLREARQKIGMIFQSFNLMPSRTVYENIELPLKHNGYPKDKRKQRIEELLSLVELSDKGNNYPSQLSGGQKQRVAIARALAGDPKVLLCDEATSALDPKTTSQILALLKKLNQELKLTIVIITHQMSVVKEICDRAAVMEQGEVIEQGYVYDLFSNPKTKLTKSFMDTANNFGSFFDILDEKGSLADVSDGTHIYLLTYTGDAAGKALMSEIYKKFTVESNILYGNIDYIKGKPLGKLAVNLTGDKDKIEGAVEYIKNSGVQLEVLK
ncbi:MAG: methionine ABC transporter ATP-binding protein [Succinivibrio sp.]|nr:methionine ABC transporter ATP-binding protein [Succinatimonas sp.]MDY6247056.1 methionine ABC transporter ATP-binding protein [Succinivibrio sp.]